MDSLKSMLFQNDRKKIPDQIGDDNSIIPFCILALGKGVKDIKDIKDSPPQEFKKAEKKKDNKDEENLIENTNNIPDPDLYFQ